MLEKKKRAWESSVDFDANGNLIGYGYTDGSGTESRFSTDNSFSGFSVTATSDVDAIYHQDGSPAGYAMHGLNGERIRYDEHGNYVGYSYSIGMDTSELWNSNQSISEDDIP